MARRSVTLREVKQARSCSLISLKERPASTENDRAGGEGGRVIKQNKLGTGEITHKTDPILQAHWELCLRKDCKIRPKIAFLQRADNKNTL